MFIFALSDNFSVAVFFHKVAVASVVHVASFESCAVLCLLDGSAVALSVAVDALVLGSAGVVDNHLSVHLAILERSLIQTFFEIGLKYIAIFLDQLTFAMLTVIAPISSIGVSIGPIE